MNEVNIHQSPPRNLVHANSNMPRKNHTSFLFLFSCLVVQTVFAADKTFEALRKAIEKSGGYVDERLGLLSPAPCGAPRGLGIVSSSKKKKGRKTDDVLFKIPIEYQLTRQLALSTLTPLMPPNVLQALPLDELDDAALLVLLLAHEKGLGKKSKFKAYIDTLSDSVDGAGCGWASEGAHDFRKLPREVEPEDVEAGLAYANRVSTGMASDYGDYLAKSAWPKAWKGETSNALLWGLCTVSSRGTAANQKPGDSEGGTGIRLVPLADMANHDLLSAGFIELSGGERIANGGFVDASSSDAGSFVIRSVWGADWKTKELDVNDEITVNYNLPYYGAVDWYMSLGFVPPEVSEQKDEL